MSIKKSADLLMGLTPREAKVLRLKTGIKIHSGSSVQTPIQAHELSCSVCGKKSRRILRMYNGKQFITICEECLALKPDDE